ncbi:MAG TPA: hypothetical protein VHO46_01575 [Bacteroidales bacterium]|nr:hypothetical protein [Bacteroidales bacterium]
MKKSFMQTIGFPVLMMGIILISLSVPFQSCEPKDDECDNDSIIVYKPNIYLYPAEESQIDVKLSFPLGGRIVTSVPAYGNGWHVNAVPSGMIDDKFEYLFYESVQPDIWQLQEGWIISKSELNSFFSNNMHEYGFNEREIKDFLDYWIPRLVDFNYYEIYPQHSNIIETAIKLEIQKNPDNVLRLFYVIKGSADSSDTSIKAPGKVSKFNREGFVVTEWGVIIK